VKTTGDLSINSKALKIEGKRITTKQLGRTITMVTNLAGDNAMFQQGHPILML